MCTYLVSFSILKYRCYQKNGNNLNVHQIVNWSNNGPRNKYYAALEKNEGFYVLIGK